MKQRYVVPPGNAGHGNQEQTGRRKWALIGGCWVGPSPCELYVPSGWSSEDQDGSATGTENMGIRWIKQIIAINWN